MLCLHPSVLAECSFDFVHFVCTRCIFHRSLLCISFLFFLDYASSSIESPQSSCHYGSEITHASTTQRSAKQFVDPFSFDTKSRDHRYEVSLGPTHLRTRTCQKSCTWSHRSSLAILNREFWRFRGSWAPPSRSAGRQQPSPTPGSQFSPDQLGQLRELIAETIGSQRSGPREAPGLLEDVPLMSPASPLNIVAITATEQNLNGVTLPNVIQDGGLSLSKFVPSLPQASQGPGNKLFPMSTIPLCHSSRRNSARWYPNMSRFRLLAPAADLEPTLVAPRPFGSPPNFSPVPGHSGFNPPLLVGRHSSIL